MESLWLHPLTVCIWANSGGWIGALAISIIVILVDVFTVLDVPLIPSVPKFAATGEISYSIAVIAYLVQPKIVRFYTRKKDG